MKTRHDLLFADFPPASYTDWKKAAQEELKKQDPETALAWQVADLEGKPYYDTSPLSFLITRHGGCINAPQVTVIHVQNANTNALQHLQGGAEGIFFRLPHNLTQFEPLLNNIEWPWCYLAFSIPQPDKSFVRALESFLKQKNFAPHTLSGTFYFNTYPQHPQVLHNLINSTAYQHNLFTLGVSLPSNQSYTNSIAHALWQAVMLVLQLQATDHPPDRLVTSVSFAVEIGADLFLEIARLRALRWLWFQVAQSFGLRHYQPHHVFIHTLSPAWLAEAYQPHANLIKSTVSAMAAVAGGANALTVVPEHEDDAKLSRLARNVTLLLKEESRLHEVSDPLAGSYYLESITAQLAEKAWKKFQNLMQA